MKIDNLGTDNIGIIASALCMVHCIATPFIFFVQTCSTTCCEASPTWWKSFDFIFLVISLFAIYHSSKNTSENWMKYAMWTSWFLLLAVIANENIQLFELYPYTNYTPAILLIVLHIYNLKCCQCETPPTL